MSQFKDWLGSFLPHTNLSSHLQKPYPYLQPLRQHSLQTPNMNPYFRFHNVALLSTFSLPVVKLKTAHLSTRVLITASVSSTRPSTFCFFRRGSWGPRPRLGGRTGSRGRLPLASGGSELSTCLSCRRGAAPSSASLSSLHTQLFPMAPRPTRLRHNWTDRSCSTVSCRTRARFLLAQNAIQVATIISLGEASQDGLRGDVDHRSTADHQQTRRIKPRS